MKQTKLFFRLILGALLIAGLFLFFKSKNSDTEAAQHLKPSQLNFNQSNELSSTHTGLESSKPETSAAKSLQALQAPKQLENFSAEEKTQWSVFENILQTKNDNDPRLDQALKKLSPTFREALYQKYEELPREDHSARGLIVYLVAREVSSMEDVQFLKKVFQESPCLSIADCDSVDNNADPHHSSTDQTTLIYKQLSALYLIDQQLSENPQLLSNPSLRSGFIQILMQAENFPVSSVREKALALRTKYGL